MVKKYVVKVKGQAYEVEVEEVMGAVAPAAPAPQAVAAPVAPAVAPAPKPAPQPEAPKASKPTEVAAGEHITAPIPGTILQVMVKEGDSVKENDVVLTLEAMKLENEICTFSAGKIKQVLVKPGDTVNEGDVLVVIG